MFLVVVLDHYNKKSGRSDAGSWHPYMTDGLYKTQKLAEAAAAGMTVKYPAPTYKVGIAEMTHELTTQVPAYEIKAFSAS